VRLSLILPIYNECENLRSNFPKIYKLVKELGESEIIIAEDGSKDCTKKYVKKFAKLPGVRLLSYKKRLGRGGALKRAIRVARGKVIAYIDIDLAVPLKYVPIAVKHVEEGNMVVVGSRYLKQSHSTRSAKRLFESLAYNALMRILLGSRIKDHQCGFKFWDASFAKSAAKIVKDNHWFFDSEMLVIAQREKLPVYEMPVEWKEQKYTKVSSSDPLYFIRSILRLRGELNKLNNTGHMHAIKHAIKQQSVKK